MKCVVTWGWNDNTKPCPPCTNRADYIAVCLDMIGSNYSTPTIFSVCSFHSDMVQGMHHWSIGRLPQAARDFNTLEDYGMYLRTLHDAKH